MEDRTETPQRLWTRDNGLDYGLVEFDDDNGHTIATVHMDKDEKTGIFTLSIEKTNPNLVIEMV